MGISARGRCRRAARARWLHGLLLLAPIGARAAELPARLDAALAAPALRGARIAALVVDAEGATVYERTPDRALIPASNMKILTALAALHVFGPTHRFATDLFSEGPPGADGSVRTLWLRGSGDPSLTSEDFWRLAADLRREGVSRVEGDLVLDDSAFDGQRWHPSWGRTGSRAYHAPVGALTVNYGAFAVSVAPGAAPGDPLRAVVDPPLAHLPLTLRGSTGPARARTTLAIERVSSADAERVVVSGVLPVGAEARTLQRSVLDPARYAGAALRAQLAAVGVEIAGETRVGYVPDSAVPLLVFDGPPMSEVVRLFMKYSNNQIGESLLKALGARATGRPGSWPAGAAALREQLSLLSLPIAGLVVVDGSGLSYENRVTPRLLVAALRAAAGAFAFGPEFEASLPIAAADGTLEERAPGAPFRVRAKTGLLTRVTGLSGYAERPGGERVVFSVLVNGFRDSAEAAMDALDRFAEALAAAP
jgi:D-alanyl-D-alanine carboxypeptidase/D-alanyl-D-alanine-endopeptidase (penicillin-binding protein 4)